MSNPTGILIAKRLIAEETQKQAGFLDLGKLGLTELPKEIHELTHLSRLNLGDNFYDEDGDFHLSANLFEANDFSNQSMSPLQLQHLKYLSICGTRVSDLSPLSGLSNLQTLDCTETRVSNLSPLSGLVSLQTLNCTETPVSDLSPLSGLANLKSLHCDFTTVSDLSPLSGLSNLQSLNCSCTSVSDLSPLSSLAKLQSLDCSGTQVSDLFPLSGLANLQSLNFEATSVSNLSLLSGLAKLQSLDCDGTRVSDLSPLLGLANLQSLDCSGTQVSDLSPLSGLVSLQTLNCTESPVSDLSPLSGLASLQSLDCDGTRVSDLSPLSGLVSLQTLNCDGTPVSDLSPLSGLAILRSLDCSGTQVSDLSPLSGLANLQSLDCDGTRVSDLSPLSGLANLQLLDCSGTPVSDLSPLSGLVSLQSVNCSETRVSDLSPLSGLANLQSVNCRESSVSDLSPLSGLASLQSVNCSETRVSNLSPLSGLANLQSVNCRESSVSDLAPLSGLANLRILNASGCVLTEFPQILLRAVCPIQLLLHKTQIPGIPAEVLSQRYHDNCREQLLAHVTDLTTGAEPVTDVKVIVIGNGRIGKTQICNRLRGEAYEEDCDSTHGINVTQTNLPMPGDSQPALLNLWDFGGQDLYHGTHALFLKSRAIFAVVWTWVAENNIEYQHGGMRFRNQPLPYWLDYVRHAAGNVSPVVLVQNQCDMPLDEILQPPADTELLKTFPYLQHVHYSAKTDRKRDSLNESLREAIQHLRGREGIATIGKGRMKVRQQLQQWLDQDAHRDRDRRQHRTLTQQQFQQLCDNAGGVSSPESLLEYLHNAGIVFYQRGLFRDEIVLDQSWALDAIYTVFNREQCYRQLRMLGGRFTRSLLEELAWPVEKYSRAEQELFLSLMESCGICFKQREADPRGRFETEYVAPDLLPDRASLSHQLAGRWQEVAPTLERAWRFNFLHPGLVRSIISSVGNKAGECAVYWKYGVWFYDAMTRASAVISQEMQNDRQGRIILQTQGERARDLLESVTEWIDQKIGCPGSAICTMEGEPLSDRRRDRPLASDREPVARDSAPVETLRVTDPPRPVDERQACVSYAWKEEQSSDPDRSGKVEKFCSNLSAAGLSIVRDNTHVALGDRLSIFMRRIGHSDRVYVFLSDAYLKSPNCMYELLTIWQTCGDDEEQFRRRTRIYTMPGTDIFSISERVKYAAHWKKQRDEIQQVFKESGVDVLGPRDLKLFKQIQDFAHHVNEMLSQIADVLQPRDFDQYIDQAINELHPGES